MKKLLCLLVLFVTAALAQWSGGGRSTYYTTVYDTAYGTEGDTVHPLFCGNFYQAGHAKMDSVDALVLRTTRIRATNVFLSDLFSGDSCYAAKVFHAPRGRFATLYGATLSGNFLGGDTLGNLAVLQAVRVRPTTLYGHTGSGNSLGWDSLFGAGISGTRGRFSTLYGAALSGNFLGYDSLHGTAASMARLRAATIFGATLSGNFLGADSIGGGTVVQATRFRGDLTGDVTGDLTGTADSSNEAAHAYAADSTPEAVHALAADSAAFADSCNEAAHAYAADSTPEAVHALAADSAAFADSCNEAAHAYDADSSDNSGALQGQDTTALKDIFGTVGADVKAQDTANAALALASEVASAFVYIAYASDDQGTDFTMVFNPALDYIAILATTEEIADPAVEDFAGLWKNYKGAVGETGTPGVPGLVWKGAWSAETTYVSGDAVSNLGSSYICIVGNTNEEPPDAEFWDVLAQGAQ